VSQPLRQRVATGCRILARQGLVRGVLGHIPARAADGSVLIRCRGPRERVVALDELPDLGARLNVRMVWDAWAGDLD
jgi:ribulose-5-phosphate 4-epimerase/fuculose-1-phosphate aldolase